MGTVEEDLWIEPSDYTKPHTVRMSVTPAVAARWLEVNTWNRRVREEQVAKNAGAMRRGQWAYNGETIKISRPATEDDVKSYPYLTEGESVIIDGQHRLLACVKADTSFETLVVFGLPPETQGTVDVGSKRQFGDVLRLTGETNASSLAAALRLFWLYEQGRVQSKLEPSPDELLQILRDYPQIRTSVSVTRSVVKLKTSDAVGAVAHFLFAALDKDKADEFFELLITGFGFESKRDPVYLLREWFHSRSREAYSRFTREYVLVMYIKTWNAFVTNRRPSAQFLRWRTGGVNPEAFPMIVDPRDTSAKDADQE